MAVMSGANCRAIRPMLHHLPHFQSHIQCNSLYIYFFFLKKKIIRNPFHCQQGPSGMKLIYFKFHKGSSSSYICSRGWLLIEVLTQAPNSQTLCAPILKVKNYPSPQTEAMLLCWESGDLPAALSGERFSQCKLCLLRTWCLHSKSSPRFAMHTLEDSPGTDRCCAFFKLQ